MAATDNRWRDNRTRAIAWLLTCQTEAGGWGYKPSGVSHTEPTALAILALLNDTKNDATAAAVARAVAWLRASQHADGAWGISPVDATPSWMTSYAVLALSRFGTPSAEPPIARALSWLLGEPRLVSSAEEIVLAKQQLSIDASLAGWPWTSGDADWVFPTSLAILAARRAGIGESPRAQTGVAYLLDRACAGGGWNFGNPYMLSVPMLPTTTDTAIALLALRETSEEHPQATAGLARLGELAAKTTTPLGLAWAVLALRVCSTETVAGPFAERLALLQDAAGSWRASPFTSALTCLALAPEPRL